MSRRGGHSSANGIQLLPFLDILTCTMGALVTLLFAFARYGQQQVVKVSDAKQVAAEAAAAAEVEDLQWRASVLRDSRAKTEADLGDARLELSHLEDHLRRLRQRAEEIHQAAIALEKADPKASQAQAGAELGKLKERITLTKQELELARQNAAGKPTTYSIVPYAGPNQTRRRPIYLECRAEGVVLEPEGIVFTDSDFAGPLGPGNPLAAAVRAAREYMAERDPNAFEQIEPYPLLVVRPDAIPQYYAARSALVSFGSQFGYELIGADKKLKFPDSDPQMAEKITTVVAEARIRQEQLIAAAPKHYRKSKSYHVKPGGGGIEQEPDSRATQDDRNPYRGIGNRGGGKGTWGNGKGNGGNGGNGAGGSGAGGTAASTSTGTTIGTSTATTNGNGNGNGGIYGGGGGTGLARGNRAGGVGTNGTGGNDPLGNGSLAGGGGTYGNGTGPSGSGGYGNGPAGQGGYGNGGGPNGLGRPGGVPGGYGNGGGPNGPGSPGSPPGGYGNGSGPNGLGPGGAPGGYPPGGGAGGNGQDGMAGGGAGGYAPGTLTAGGGPGTGGGAGGPVTPSGKGGPGTPGGVPGSGLSALADNGSAAAGATGAAGAGGPGGPGGSGDAQTGAMADGGDDTPGGVGQGDTDGLGGDGTSGNSPGAPGQVGSGGGGSSGGRLARGGQSQPGNGAAGGTAPGSGTPQTTTLQGTGGSTAGNTNGTGSGTGPGGGGLGGAGGKALGNAADTMPNGAAQRPSNGGPAVPNTRVQQATNANSWSLGGGADNTGPANNNTSANNSSANSTSGGSSPSGGSTNSGSAGSGGGNSSSSASSGMSGSSPPQGGQQGGLGIPNINIGQKPQDPSVAGRHGGKKGGGQRPPGWGLPDVPDTSASVSRPVVIECWSDKLAIIGDDGKTISKQIPLSQHTEDAVDELVSSVLQHTKQWGVAGKGLYWKPTLTMRVAPEARSRFEELQTLLADSGLDVKESSHRPSIAGKPGSPLRK